jgi:hypothetical protein
MNVLAVANFIGQCPNEFIRRDGSCRARIV